MLGCNVNRLDFDIRCFIATSNDRCIQTFCVWKNQGEIVSTLLVFVLVEYSPTNFNSTGLFYTLP